MGVQPDQDAHHKAPSPSRKRKHNESGPSTSSNAIPAPNLQSSSHLDQNGDDGDLAAVPKANKAKKIKAGDTAEEKRLRRSVCPALLAPFPARIADVRCRTLDTEPKLRSPSPMSTAAPRPNDSTSSVAPDAVLPNLPRRRSK